MTDEVDHGRLSGGELPWFISVDDHVLEPPGVWTSRLPSKYQDAAPHYERRRVGQTRYVGGAFVTGSDDSGPETDVWVFGDVAKPIRRNIASVGLEREEMDLNPIEFATMRRGVYDPIARLEDMDLNHVEASLCFPQMSRFCGQEFSEAKDRELGMACIKAYNDWMVDEWAAAAPERLIPLQIVPLWDPVLAAGEIMRNAERGFPAVAFSENPAVLGFASIHSGQWEPFFQACNETDTTVCMHIGSSSKMESVSPDAPPAVQISLTANNAMSSLMEYLFSGLLERYPRLQLAYSESQVGWLPYQLERADTVWQEHRAWNGVAMERPPSYYYFRQVYGCFFRDYFGLRNLADVGVDNVTFEVDYPHTDSTWPDSQQVAKEMFATLTDEEVYKVVRGNAIRMLHLGLDKHLDSSGRPL
jgi:predicted TIM-barrel fold metal-dependent hydrolase